MCISIRESGQTSTCVRLDANSLLKLSLKNGCTHTSHIGIFKIFSFIHDFLKYLKK